VTSSMMPLIAAQWRKVS